MRQLPLALLMLLLGACSTTPAPRHFSYANPSPEMVVWPSRPDLPRYRYVGELHGDANFIAEEKGRSLLEWVTGLFLGNDRSRMLQRPQGGHVDASGRIYVTDISRQAVFVFDPAQNRYALWEYAGERERFQAPVAICSLPSGELLVTDADLGVVVRLDPQGKPLGRFGQGELQRPTGIAYDAQNRRIFVADTHAHDIKVFTVDGTHINTLGRRGEGEGEFNYPLHLAFANDRLYVTDAMNARVQVLFSNGRFSHAIGQRGTFIGNTPHPKGVATDNDGNIYIIESYYDHLLVFNGDGQFLLPIGGTGSGIGQFYLPAGVWTDNNDRIYIADMFNGRVVVLQYLGGDS